MGGSKDIWKPVAVQLVKEMAKRQVNIDKFYLFTYVNKIQSSLETQNHQALINKMENWSNFCGSEELNFAALKHAMEQVNNNAFICVWTDEIGSDTHNASLKANILHLKASIQSEIFFMVVTPKNTKSVSMRSPPAANSLSAVYNEDNSPKNKRRYVLTVLIKDDLHYETINYL